MRPQWIVLLALVAACKKDPEPSSVSPLLPTADGARTAPAPAPAPIDSRTPPAALPMGVTWEDPPAFERIPDGSPMRKATYRVPRAKGDDADGELAVFYFGPADGGRIDDNAKRWIQQFSETKGYVRRADREANGIRQHTVEVENGTFNSSMPNQPPKKMPGYGLLGGIVSAPSGLYFFKLTGPSATVKAARKPFYALLDSVKVSS